MRTFARAALLVFLAFASTVVAQSGDANRTRINAHKSDFDYLLGDWKFVAKNKQYGTIYGLWSATRVGDGALILDEYRIVGDKGETYYVTRTLRAYNPTLDQWDLVSSEDNNGLQNVGSGRLENGEMHITQQFGTGTKNASTLRIRYYNIGADHFSWTADRSTDGGKTWTKDFQQIEATRVAPARSIASFTPEKNNGIDAFNRALDDATRKMDNAAVLALWEDDGVSVLPSTPPIAGKKAIAAFLDKVTSEHPGARMESFENRCSDPDVSGSWASETCVEHQIVSFPDGTKFDGRGNLMYVLHRGADGRWRISREMWNQAAAPAP